MERAATRANADVIKTGELSFFAERVVFLWGDCVENAIFTQGWDFGTLKIEVLNNYL